MCVLTADQDGLWRGLSWGPLARSPGQWTRQPISSKYVVLNRHFKITRTVWVGAKRTSSCYAMIRSKEKKTHKQKHIIRRPYSFDCIVQTFFQYREWKNFGRGEMGFGWWFVQECIPIAIKIRVPAVLFGINSIHVLNVFLIVNYK